MIISDSAFTKKTFTSVTSSGRKTVTKGTGFTRKTVTKGTSAFTGVNIASSAFGIRAFGMGEYGGLSHFKGRVRSEVNHD